MRLFAALPVIACALAAVPSRADDPKRFNVTARSRIEVPESKTVIDPATGAAQIVPVARLVPKSAVHEIDPAKCAVVVCDMWDDHWCKKASERCAELAKRAEPVLKACRASGMTIVHCPSDTMPFYKDHPARKRVAAVKKTEPPKSKDRSSPALPVDDSDGGCDDEKPAKPFKAWTRQHAAITIDGDRDYITDSGTEVYSIMKEKGVHTLFVMGVHTNMCVLNRSFAIKQMVKWSVQTFLVRDLTDAMYNPKMRPMVTHDEGTRLIIEHIETHWCPTVLAKDLVQ